LVAGEASGDRLGAALMSALRQRCGTQLRFSGVGGSQMEAAGLASLFPIDDLAIIGLAAIPGRLAAIFRRIRETAEAAVAARADAGEARRRLDDPPVLLVFPGSRDSEIRRLMGIFGETIGLLQARCGALDVVLPTLPHLADRVRAASADWPVRPRIVVEQAEK